MVSAGELHLPGLDYNHFTPELMTSLALLAKATTGRIRCSGAKVHAGTLLMVPGMTEEDFDKVSNASTILTKFLFYPLAPANKEEAQRYVRWCHERGLRVKVHTGGVIALGLERCLRLRDAVLAAALYRGAYLGGPIPMPDEDLDAMIDNTEFALEICSSGNYRSAIRAVERLIKAGRLDRLTLGADTPGGTGVLARGMLRHIIFLSSVCGLSAGEVIAVATGNTAKAHGLDTGILNADIPADLVTAGQIDGSAGTTLTEAIEHGDLPGVTAVMIDGELMVEGRSEQTPPPQERASVEYAYGCQFCG